MKRLLAIIGVALLSFLGIAGTAAAAEDFTDEEVACLDDFDDAFLDLTAELDDVQFDQLLYDIDDLFTQFDLGLINEDELAAGIDALFPGLLALFIDLIDCIDAAGIGDVDPPKPEPRAPVAVPTAVPAGVALPETGGSSGALALVGLALAAAGGLVLLTRRLVR